MNKRMLIAVLCSLPLLGHAQENPRALFHHGEHAYNAGDYSTAAEKFREAAAAAQADPKANLPAANAIYNAAMAELAAGQAAAAADSLAAGIPGLADLDAQAKAFYNRGNTLFALADPMAGEDAGKNVAEALDMYERALTLKPDYPDAKANYELALQRQQEIQEQQQQDQQDQEQSDDQDQQQDQEQQSQSSEGEQDEQQQDQQQQQQSQQDQQQQDSPQDQQQEQQSGEDQQEQTEEQNTQPEPRDSREMTPEDAERLLDAMLAQEQAQRGTAKPHTLRPIPVEKDW